MTLKPDTKRLVALKWLDELINAHKRVNKRCITDAEHKLNEILFETLKLTLAYMVDDQYE